MKILLVNDFYTPHMVGGAETYVRALSHALAGLGHTVAVCTARVGDLPRQSTDENGIQIHRIGRFPGLRRSVAIASGTAPSRLAALTVADFESALDLFQPDAIHFQNVWLLGPALIAEASKQSDNVGVTLHDYWPVCVRRSMVRVNWEPCPGPDRLNCSLCRLRAPSTWRSLDILGIERDMAEHAAALGGCKFVTAPSQFVARQVEKGIGKQVTVVPNGVCVPSDRPVCDVAETHPGVDGPYVLFASRTTVEKGYDISLKAFNDPRLERYTLVVAGDAPQRRARVGPNVKVLGRQAPGSMVPLMAGASCVVVPSLWPEPFGLVLAEAMLQGVPVVATRRGAIPEIVEDGVTGILIEPPSASALANAVVRACTDETLRASARRNGPRTVRERFSLDVVAARFEALYAA